VLNTMLIGFQTVSNLKPRAVRQTSSSAAIHSELCQIPSIATLPERLLSLWCRCPQMNTPTRRSNP